jgi:hypothetical protein
MPRDAAEEQDMLDQQVVETADDPELLDDLLKEATDDDELDAFGEPPNPGMDEPEKFGRLRR